MSWNFEDRHLSRFGSFTISEQRNRNNGNVLCERQYTYKKVFVLQRNWLPTCACAIKNTYPVRSSSCNILFQWGCLTIKCVRYPLAQRDVICPIILHQVISSIIGTMHLSQRSSICKVVFLQGHLLWLHLIWHKCMINETLIGSGHRYNKCCWREPLRHIARAPAGTY